MLQRITSWVKSKFSDNISSSMFFGFILLIIYKLIDKDLTTVQEQLSSLNPTLLDPKSAAIVDVFSQTKDYFLWGGISLIMGGVIFNIVTGWLLKIWNTHIQPELNKNIVEANKENNDLLKTNTVERVLEIAEPDDLQRHKPRIFSAIYGNHCEKASGLFNHLTCSIFPYLHSNKPYRANYVKKISLSELPDNNFKWSEICEYDLHCIALDSDYLSNSKSTSIQYEIKYGADIQLGGKLETFSELWNLKIEFENHCIFDSSSDLVIENHILTPKPEKKENISSVSFSNGWLRIKIRANVKIEKPYSKVSIIETSKVQDDLFTLKFPEPVRNALIDIHLPDGWEFKEFYVPDDEFWTYHLHPENSLSTKTKGWVLPGIGLCCKWGKKLDG